MSGPVIAAVIIPVVVVPVLFGWIAIVYYADSHPDRRLRRGPGAARAFRRHPGPGAASARQRPGTGPADGVGAGPAAAHRVRPSVARSPACSSGPLPAAADGSRRRLSEDRLDEVRAGLGEGAPQPVGKLT